MNYNLIRDNEHKLLNSTHYSFLHWEIKINFIYIDYGFHISNYLLGKQLLGAGIKND